MIYFLNYFYKKLKGYYMNNPLTPINWKSNPYIDSFASSQPIKDIDLAQPKKCSHIEAMELEAPNARIKEFAEKAIKEKAPQNPVDNPVEEPAVEENQPKAPTLRAEPICWPFEDILAMKVNDVALGLLDGILDLIASFFDIYNERKAYLELNKPIIDPNLYNKRFEETFDFFASFFDSNDDRKTRFELNKQEKLKLHNINPDENNNKPINDNNGNNGEIEVTPENESAARVIQGKIRNKEFSRNILIAEEVRERIEEMYSAKFSKEDIDELMIDILNPTDAITTFLQKFIDLEWDRIVNTVKEPTEAWREFVWLDQNLAFRDRTNEWRWNNVKFQFGEGEALTEKEYPYYILHILRKDSDPSTPNIFNLCIDENNKDSMFKENDTYPLQQTNEEQFDHMINITCPGVTHSKRVTMHNMDFKAVESLYRTANFFGFKSVIDKCRNKAIELLGDAAKKGFNAEYFDEIIRVLITNPEFGHAKNFRTAAMTYFSNCFSKLKSGEELQNAFKKLSINIEEKVYGVPFLNLKLAKQTTDEDLKVLCEHAPTLDFLDLSNCKDITDEGLKHIWQLPNLKTLIIDKNENITSAGFYGIDSKDKCPLKTLIIKDCPGISDHILMFSAKMKNLRRLELFNLENLQDTWIGSIAQMEKLRVLNLSGSCHAISEEKLLNIFELELTNLNVCRSPNFSDKCLEKLSSKPLKVLDISGCDSVTLDANCLAHLKNMKNLITLYLTVSEDDVFDQKDFEDNFLEANKHVITITNKVNR